MKIIYTKNAPEPVGPYSQGVEKNNMIFFSGQIGLKNGELQNSNIETETKQVLENLNTLLKETNLEKKNILKASIFLTNLDNFQIVNKIYEDFLEGHKPARETVEVSKLPLGAKIEISLIAMR